MWHHLAKIRRSNLQFKVLHRLAELGYYVIYEVINENKIPCTAAAD